MYDKSISNLIGKRDYYIICYTAMEVYINIYIHMYSIRWEYENEKKN